MKRLRHFCVASVLTFTLTFSAIAGEIECGVVASPPPQSSATGDIHTGYVDPVTEFGLSFLQSLLSLF